MGNGVAPAVPKAAHSAGQILFQQTLDMLLKMGWQRLRIDTYVHPDHIWTVRHHYCHDEWEWYHEPDRYWNPHTTTGKLVRVRLDRPPLPNARQVIQELLGINERQLSVALQTKQGVAQ